MKPATLDYQVLDRLGLSRSPVGVKFLPYRPEGIQRVERDLNFCQMFVAAQTSEPFYAEQEDFRCVEPMILGMKELDPVPLSGLVGELDGLYEELRANQKAYYVVPRLLRGSVKCVLFAALTKMAFDPDILIITTDNVDQARTIMRATVFSTGEAWTTRGTPILACSWMYLYPYITGEVNFMVSGMSMGMQALRVLPQGLIIISIPWPKLPMVLSNLQKMEWNPISESITGEEHKKRFAALLARIEEMIER